jgi:hypothetical protein
VGGPGEEGKVRGDGQLGIHESVVYIHVLFFSRGESIIHDYLVIFDIFPSIDKR